MEQRPTMRTVSTKLEAKKPSSEDRTKNLREVAESYGVSTRTVQRWVAEARAFGWEIGKVQADGSVLYSKDEQITIGKARNKTLEPKDKVSKVETDTEQAQQSDDELALSQSILDEEATRNQDVEMRAAKAGSDLALREFKAFRHGYVVTKAMTSKAIDLLLEDLSPYETEGIELTIKFTPASLDEIARRT